jgi:hypothetical protein
MEIDGKEAPAEHPQGTLPFTIVVVSISAGYSGSSDPSCYYFALVHFYSPAILLAAF